MNAGMFEKVDESDFVMEADLVLLAMGFVGPEREGLLTDLGVEITDRGNVARDPEFATTVPGVFVATTLHIMLTVGSQMLIVWVVGQEQRSFRAEAQSMFFNNFDWEMMTYWAIVLLSHALRYHS